MIAAVVLGGGLGVLLSGGPAPFAGALLGRAMAAVAPQKTPPSVAALAPKEPVTVLVMGVEGSPQYSAPQLTDSMMVWGFDPASRTAQILSVPRDLWVDLPGFGPQRINAALEDGGPAAAELTVERYVGVPIEYYAVVDYSAFVKLVNDVGGINVNVPYNIDDTCYPNPQENRCTVYRLSKGPHHMDGAQALKFARERHAFANEDLTREANQQLVLLALKRALLKPSNLLHLPSIVGDLGHLVTTNLPYSDIPQLAASAIRLPKTALSTRVLALEPGTVSAITTGGGADVLQPHEAVIRRDVRSLFAPELSYMSAATIQVEDGAPTQQPLATYFSQVLDGMGAHTLPAEQAARTDRKLNHVYWNSAAATGPPPVLAHILAAMLDAKLTTQAFPGSRAPIVVILGSAFPKVQP